MKSAAPTRGRALLLLGSAAAACGFGPDLTALDQVAAGVAAADPSYMPLLITVGLTEPGVGLVPRACAEALHASANVDPAQRATLYGVAFDACPDTCAGPVAAWQGEIAALAPEAKTAAVLARCDAAGPDPVFGGDLAALRPAMPAHSYLLVRMLIEKALAATHGTAAEQRWLDLRDDLALGLAARPDAPAPDPDAGVLARLEPPPLPPKPEGGSATRGETTVTGSLDRAAVDDVLVRYRNQIRYCYQRGLTQVPSLAGSLSIEVSIAPDGTVTSARTVAGKVDDTVQACVEGRFLRMQFPPTDGKPAVAVASFTFAP